MFAASSSTPTSGVASRPPGERLASCSAASHNAIASAVTKPGAELPCPSLLCRYSVSGRRHERGEVQLRLAGRRSGWVTQRAMSGSRRNERICRAVPNTPPRCSNGACT